MNKRQIRLCRVLLDHYDSSGGQPLPLAQLARKVGYDGSDIYDRDSQSGDLWPFDAKARGPYAGMLAFTTGKGAAVTVTSAGLAGLEKLMGDEPASVPTPKAPIARIEAVAEAAPEPAPAPAPAPVPAPLKPAVATKPPMRARTRPVFQEAAPTPAAPVVEPPPAPVVAAAPTAFSAADIADARERFNTWLSSDPAGMGLLFQYEGQVLVEAAFDKFFRDFLKSRENG